MNIDLGQLNEAQREAVVYTGGPQLVIAGAGSGKTRVLTYKIAHLLTQGYEPWRILALTFTIKAANEMKERIAMLVGRETASRLWMGTFHSIFSRILHANAEAIGFRHDFTIYDTADSRSLIKSIIKEAGLDDKIYKPAVVQSIISNAKNALITPAAYAQNEELRKMDRNQNRPLIYSIYNTYWSRCFKAGAMDFDDLLLYTNILFRDHPDVAQRYRDLFRYVLVDEYQDTNFSQHLIVTQLCRESGKLCVVGDDAQSIYSFRGANIGNILNLKNEYPDLRIDKLEQNYRSTQNIVDAANSLIKKNHNQIPKNVYSHRQRGSKVMLCSAYSDYEEGYMIANRIMEMHMLHNHRYSEFAILYRTNSQSRSLEEALRNRNIPYRIYGGVAFYQRKEIKDAVAYLRLVVNPNDEEAMKRVINYPSRGIGDTTVSKVLTAAHTHNIGVWDVLSAPIEYNVPINNGTRAKLSVFVELISSLQKLAEEEKDIAELVRQVLQRSGMITEIYASDTPENVSQQENIESLQDGVYTFMSNRMEEGVEETTLADFLAEISLITDQDRNEDGNEDKVTLMTVHASKGLEFRNVFITGMEEELFPSIMSVEDMSQIEEERRLLYVAVTRAKENCVMSYAQTRFRNGKTNTCRPSRFLNDFDPSLLDRKDGVATVRNQTDVNEHSGGWKSSWWGKSTATNDKTSSTKRTLRSMEPTSDNRNTPQPQESVTTPSGKLDVGCRIRHDRFGSGVVEAIEGVGDNCKITVQFDIVGRKQLLLKFAKFTII